MNEKKTAIVVVVVIAAMMSVGVYVVGKPLHMWWVYWRLYELEHGNGGRGLKDLLVEESRSVDVEYLKYGLRHYEDLPRWHPLRKMVSRGYAQEMLGMIGDSEGLVLLEKELGKWGRRFCERGDRESYFMAIGAMRGLISCKEYDQRRLYEMVVSFGDHKLLGALLVGWNFSEREDVGLLMEEGVKKRVEMMEAARKKKEEVER